MEAKYFIPERYLNHLGFVGGCPSAAPCGRPFFELLDFYGAASR